MNIKYKIAWRFVNGKRDYNFINIISRLSFFGITIGVATLICIMSLFKGLQELNISQLTKFEPHIRISPTNGNQINNAILDKIHVEQFKEIQNISPTIEVKAAGFAKKGIQTFVLKGIEKSSKRIEQIGANTVIGKFNISDNSNSLNLGVGLLNKLEMMVGKDTMQIFSLDKVEYAIRTGGISSGSSFKIASAYSSNLKQLDDNIAFININSARQIANIENDSYSYFDIYLDNSDNADLIADKLNSLIANNPSLKSSIKISTWKDMNSAFYTIMKFERFAVFAVLSLVIIIAAFNIFASLSMTAVEKKSEIALLKVMGMKASEIKQIFVIQGLMIGLSSAIIGSILGILLVKAQENFSLISFEPGKYIVDALPVKFNYPDVFLIFAFASLLTYITTLLPSKKAYETNIIEAIKSE
jgi:lipoprotein-releasing system permease protein